MRGENGNTLVEGNAASPAAEKAEWVQNPTLVVEQRPVARFRVRGWGTREVDDPALVQALLEGGAVNNPHIVKGLIEAGVFVQEADVPRFVNFVAPLSFRLPPLFPRTDKRSVHRSSHRCRVNSNVCWQRSTRRPAKLRGRVWDPSALAAPPLLWVEDPNTRIWFPFWPDRAIGECVSLLARRRLSPEALTPKQRRVLEHARILIPDVGAPDQATVQARWDSRCQALQAHLIKNRYLVLRDLFSPLHIAHLRAYFRRIEKEGYLHRGDSQVERRHSLYREELSTQLHEQLVPLVSQITGTDLQPTYSFLGVYQPGAVLERHRDRPQCQWNLSLIWDTRPERSRRDAWPIHLEVDGVPRKEKLAMGDGLLYQGTELYHWRDRQPARNRTTATFFHFVDTEFEGDLD